MHFYLSFTKVPHLLKGRFRDDIRLGVIIACNIKHWKLEFKDYFSYVRAFLQFAFPAIAY